MKNFPSGDSYEQNNNYCSGKLYKPSNGKCFDYNRTFFHSARQIFSWNIICIFTKN